MSVRRDAGEPVIHVYAESSPGTGFTSVEAGLEDVYFHTLKSRDTDAIAMEA